MCDCTMLQVPDQTCSKCGKTRFKDGGTGWIIKIGNFDGGVVYEHEAIQTLRQIGYDENKLSDGAFMAFLFRIAISVGLNHPDATKQSINYEMFAIKRQD